MSRVGNRGVGRVVSADRDRFHHGVAEAVRKARHEAGLTLRQLGEQSGISHSLVTAIEQGLTVPSLWAMAQMAEAMDTTIDALAPVQIAERDAAE